MKRTLSIPVILTASLVVTACLADLAGAQAQSKPLPQSGSGWNDGAKIYAKVCAHCHDTGVGPVLRGRGLPAAYFPIFVRNGMRAMPAFRVAEIDDAALAQLAEYLAKQ